MSKARTVSEVERLREELRETQETLNAIRNGEVDALMIDGEHGEQVYTLRGADYSARMLLQEMSEGAATLVPDGTILYCNKRFAEVLRFPHEKIIGASAREFVTPTARPAYDALLQEASSEIAKAELSFTAADGRLISAYCSVAAVSIGEEPCLSMVLTDLTEQKRNEEILAAASLTNSIFEQAAEIIVVCDLSGEIIQASREAHEFWGKSVLRRSFREIFQLDGDWASEDLTGLPERWLSTKPIQGLEVTLRRPDGGSVPMLMSAGALRDKLGAAIGCVVTLNDISQIKEAEQALRESEQKFREQAQELEQQLIASGRLVSLGEITASMAHEFNNPLGIIMGFVDDLLSSADPSGPDFEPLRIIDEEAKRCQKIIQGLMEFARPSPAALQSSEIGPLIAKTGKLIEARLFKQKVTLTESVAPDLPPIHADPQQLEQVLVNLYLNALDAMAGGGELNVCASREPTPVGFEIVITVADTGSGIPRANLEKIFRPFFTTGKKAGMGLGLSICERIVRNHGGKIEVETEANRGTAFRIRLPATSPLG